MSSRFDILDIEDKEDTKKRRERQKKDRENKLKEIEKRGICEYPGCEISENVKWIRSMTQYNWDVDKEPEEDPNRSAFLCERCAKEYIDYWQERWDDYNSGRL
jgi:hypothetical protein